MTGAWTLGVGLSAYCISKELYVINAEVSIYGGGLYLAYDNGCLGVQPDSWAAYILITFASHTQTRAYLISGTGRDGTIPENARTYFPGRRDGHGNSNLPKVRNHGKSNSPKVRDHRKSMVRGDED